MKTTSSPLTPKHTFMLLVVPMLATVLCCRLYLHLVRVQHAYPGGYLVHHLFTGVLIVLPAAFVLAFGTRFRSLAVITRLALGIGTGLIIDELTYLTMTHATDADYVSDISLTGSVIFIGAGVLLALGLYKWHDCKRREASADKI